MSEILLYYKRPDPTTWVYMSSFLTIGLFFVFHRFWSIRNLDIILLILLAPGLLMVYEGRRRQLVESEAVAQTHAFPAARPQPDPFQCREPASGIWKADATLPGLRLDAVRQARTTQSSAPEDADSDAVDSKPSIQDRGFSHQADPDAISPRRQPRQRIAASLSIRRRSRGSTVTRTSRVRSSAAPTLPATFNAGGSFICLWWKSFILLRLMLDPLMVRRPLLDPNLTTGGLNFIGISLFIFMMANVVDQQSAGPSGAGPRTGAWLRDDEHVARDPDAAGQRSAWRCVPTHNC